MVDLAMRVWDAMLPVLAEDSTPLHWIVNFTALHRSAMDTEFKNRLYEFVTALPGAAELLKRDINVMLLVLMKRECHLIGDPESAGEYMSPFLHALAFANCALSLSALSDAEIAEKMASALFATHARSQNRRDASRCLGELAATMSLGIGECFFLLILSGPRTEPALIAGQHLLARGRLELLKWICVGACDIIGTDPDLLDYLMRLIGPSLGRLIGDDSIIVEFIRGLFESVSESTPLALQESLLDFVGFVWVRLDTFGQMVNLAPAARNLHPDLWKRVAGCFDAAWKRV
jgi:hypothetical protein